LPLQVEAQEIDVGGLVSGSSPTEAKLLSEESSAPSPAARADHCWHRPCSQRVRPRVRPLPCSEHVARRPLPRSPTPPGGTHRTGHTDGADRAPGSAPARLTPTRRTRRFRRSWEARTSWQGRGATAVGRGPVRAVSTERSNTTVIPVKYGFLDAFRFWSRPQGFVGWPKAGGCPAGTPNSWWRPGSICAQPPAARRAGSADAKCFGHGGHLLCSDPAQRPVMVVAGTVGAIVETSTRFLRKDLGVRSVRITRVRNVKQMMNGGRVVGVARDRDRGVPGGSARPGCVVGQSTSVGC
jgi:hypothetical protein